MDWKIVQWVKNRHQEGNLHPTGSVEVPCRFFTLKFCLWQNFIIVYNSGIHAARKNPSLGTMPMCVHRCMPVIKTEKNPSLGNSRKRGSPAGDLGVDRLPCHAKACVDQCHSRLAPERALRYPAIM